MMLFPHRSSAPKTYRFAPPKYFELVASLSPTAEPGSRLRGAFAAGGGGDDDEYRIAGIMDATSSRVVLPEIALRGA